MEGQSEQSRTEEIVGRLTLMTSLVELNWQTCDHREGGGRGRADVLQGSGHGWGADEQSILQEGARRSERQTGRGEGTGW
jgi:hypothetical protein